MAGPSEEWALCLNCCPVSYSKKHIITTLKQFSVCQGVVMLLDTWAIECILSCNGLLHCCPQASRHGMPRQLLSVSLFGWSNMFGPHKIDQTVLCIPNTCSCQENSVCVFLDIQHTGCKVMFFFLTYPQNRQYYKLGKLTWEKHI